MAWWNPRFLGRAAIISLVATFGGIAVLALFASAKAAAIVAVIGILVTAALARAWGFTRDEQRRRF